MDSPDKPQQQDRSKRTSWPFRILLYGAFALLLGLFSSIDAAQLSLLMAILLEVTVNE